LRECWLAVNRNWTAQNSVVRDDNDAQSWQQQNRKLFQWLFQTYSEMNSGSFGEKGRRTHENLMQPFSVWCLACWLYNVGITESRFAIDSFRQPKTWKFVCF
jgi:hypothetical protein